MSTAAPNTALLTRLMSALDRQALGHALLFVLPPAQESQKAWTGPLLEFLAAVLCLERKEGQGACRSCDSCRLVLTSTSSLTPAWTHPDFISLIPEEKTHYTVEDVRSLLQSFHLARSLSPYRVAWIPQAHLLCENGHTAAAQALLKVLEEPRPNSFLVLLTERPDALLPTLRSRCHTFRLPYAEENTGLLSYETALTEEWRPLLTWLQAGAPVGRAPVLPADREAFWKNRDQALKTLEVLYAYFWEGLRDHWEPWSRDQALRIWNFFQKWQDLTIWIRGYANAPLQWLEFRSAAALDP